MSSARSFLATPERVAARLQYPSVPPSFEFYDLKQAGLPSLYFAELIRCKLDACYTLKYQIITLKKDQVYRGPNPVCAVSH
jgi:hypothetical protein